MEAHMYFDRNTNTPGLVERLRKAEEELEDIQVERKVQKKVVSFFGMIGGAFVMIVWEIVKMAAASHK